MPPLPGSQTEANLRAAFALETQAHRRYLYFARMADVEGHPDVAGAFRETAEGEAGHAHGHLDYLRACGDPATGLPFGSTEQNLRSAIHGETADAGTVYPGMAEMARSEGFPEIAAWFDTLARAEQAHADRFTKLLDRLR